MIEKIFILLMLYATCGLMTCVLTIACDEYYEYAIFDYIVLWPVVFTVMVFKGFVRVCKTIRRQDMCLEYVHCEYEHVYEMGYCCPGCCMKKMFGGKQDD